MLRAGALHTVTFRHPLSTLDPFSSFFNPDQFHLLETFASQAALAIERAQLADQAQQLPKQLSGGQIQRAPHIVHGKMTNVTITVASPLLAGLPQTFPAMRYHSLVVERAGLPDQLEISAQTEDDGTVMALRHRQFPVHGVQFHPESIMTREGAHVLRNFLNLGERR